MLLALPRGAVAAPRSFAADSADYLGAGRAFQPTLFVNKDDRFWPVSFLNVVSLTWDNRFTCLVNARSKKKVCGGAGRPLSIKVLPPGRGGKSDHLDYPAGRADIDDQAKSFQQNVSGPETSARTYFYAGFGRRAAGAIASFQYWYFYNFNYVASSLAFRGYHEGDFEQVAILFAANGKTPTGQVRKVPKYVFLSQHNGGQLLKWNSSSLKRSDASPMVYAAKGTHANYAACGEHSRGALPRDFSDCDGAKLYSFRSAPLIPLKEKSWPCWRGRLARGGSLPRYGAAPRPPLQQQGFFDRTPDDLCSRYASGAALGGSAPDAGDDTAAGLFDDCRDWQRPPDSVGGTLVACDEAILDRFFASGLSDPGPAHLRLEAPGQPADTDPPAIATSADAGIVGRVRIKADRGAEPTVYAAERRADGTLLEARFAKAAIEPGAVARVTRSDHLWRLVDSSGRVLSARQPRVLRRAEPPRPAGVSVGRDGRRARIRWRIRDAGSRATTFYVAARPPAGGFVRAHGSWDGCLRPAPGPT